MLAIKKFERICKLPIILRALPPEYTNWIGSDALNLNQVNFFNLMIDNGHADYCVLRATSLLHDDELDVIKAWRVLNIASKAKAESADYFLALLDASTAKGENIETTISNFTKFFEAQKLGALHRNIVGWELLTGTVSALFFGVDVCQMVQSSGLSAPLKALAKEMGGYRVIIWFPLGMIMNIPRLKYVSSVALTVNFVGSEGHSVSGQSYIIIKLILGLIVMYVHVECCVMKLAFNV